MERDDNATKFDDKAESLGREWLVKVIAAMGGAEKLDAIHVYREKHEREVNSGSVKYLHSTTRMIDHKKNAARINDVWKTEGKDDLSYVRVLDGDRSYFSSNKKQKMYGQAQREFRRQTNRDLLTILKSRNRPDFSVGLIGQTDTDVSLVVFFDRTATGMKIDPRQTWLRN